MNCPQAGQCSTAGDNTHARVAGPRARPRRPPRCLTCPACPTRCLLPVHASAPPHGLPTVWHQSTTACQASFAVLEKNALKPHLKQQWCIPPAASGEFVWRMEDVLEVYMRPYDPRRPLVRLHETSKQLRPDGPASQLPAPGRPARVDDE